MTTSIPALLVIPKGDAPFPALVLLHGCDGPGYGERYDQEWLSWLQAEGYFLIYPDSLTPRGFKSACDGGTLSFRSQALDGLGALAYLRNRPDVIPTKIGVIGWSHGGAAALMSAAPGFIRRNGFEGGGYQALVSFYPHCGVFEEGRLGSPLLLLLGAADDWESPAQCIEHGKVLQEAGAPITVKVYPAATHAFDFPAPDRIRNIANRQVHLRYDATAAADARVQVRTFLKTYLH